MGHLHSSSWRGKRNLLMCNAIEGPTRMAPSHAHIISQMLKSNPKGPKSDNAENRTPCIGLRCCCSCVSRCSSATINCERTCSGRDLTNHNAATANEPALAEKTLRQPIRSCLSASKRQPQKSKRQYPGCVCLPEPPTLLKTRSRCAWHGAPANAHNAAPPLPN